MLSILNLRGHCCRIINPLYGLVSVLGMGRNNIVSCSCLLVKLYSVLAGVSLSGLSEQR